MSDAFKVLFVCVHNAARSRMAEALLCKLGGPRFEVASAGFEPRPVNPLVVEAMAQVVEVRDAIRDQIAAWLRTFPVDPNRTP